MLCFEESKIKYMLNYRFTFKFKSRYCIDMPSVVRKLQKNQLNHNRIIIPMKLLFGTVVQQVGQPEIER